MGVNAQVVCRGCKVAATEIGDFGYIGHPSLDDTPELVIRLQSLLREALGREVPFASRPSAPRRHI